MMKKQLASLAVLLMIVLSGCASVGGFLDEIAEQERLRWEPQVTPVDLTYALPVVTAQDPERQIQSSGNVTISVAPSTFQATTVQQATYEPLSRPSALTTREFMKKESPRVSISPQRLTFNVKINNQHERVLRLDGTIVRVNVNGQILNLAQNSYNDFLNGLVLPRQEQEFTIVGPSPGQLPDGAVIGLLLYDVVTQTDAAGQPTERQNFEWFFVHRAESHSRTVDSVEQRVRMEQAEARQVGAPWPVDPAGGG